MISSRHLAIASLLFAAIPWAQARGVRQPRPPGEPALGKPITGLRQTLSRLPGKTPHRKYHETKQ